MLTGRLKRDGDGPSGPDRLSRQEKPRPFRRPRFWILVGLLLALNWYLVSMADRVPAAPDVAYTEFRSQVEAGNVAQVTSTGDRIQGEFRRAIQVPGDNGPSSTVRFETQRPAFADDDLIGLLTDHDVVVNAKPLTFQRPLWQTLLLGFGPTLLLVGLFVLLLRRGGGLGGVGGLGRSRARRYEHGTGRTTFVDVAGIDEAEQELVEVVDFLREPAKYARLGGVIPKGVLLSGPPGTGKTLLARAVAGEAGAPFFSLSASEFVEMVAGVGASRVRDLFKQAKEAAPAIVFIDELDAVGRTRGAHGGFAGHDEREQTLNQILTEMDGFSGSEGVIVIAATNRPETLDSALLRPGRFDRRVVVSPPDRRGRRAILELHTRAVPLADDVDLDAIAGLTPGMVGADLRNLVNEAALAAARGNRDSVGQGEFGEAMQRVVLGVARSIVLSQEERDRIAYHEAGHALLGMLLPGADTVRKVSIVPRGHSLGVTYQSPDGDRYGYVVSYLRQRIVGLLGGRAAEDLVYGDVASGAESDIEHVTAIARQMVGRWGMSGEIGLVAVLPPGADGASAEAWASERTRELADVEVRRIVNECYREALAQLELHRERLDSLAEALLERETLDGDEIYEVAGLPVRPPSITVR